MLDRFVCLYLAYILWRKTRFIFIFNMSRIIPRIVNVMYINLYVRFQLNTLDTIVLVENIFTGFGGGVSLSRGCQTWVPEKPSIYVKKPAFLTPQEAVPQVSNPPGGPLSCGGGMPIGPENFWSHRACLGYGSVHGPTLTKTLCLTRPVGGTYDR